jgi:hypothetical protein
MQGHEIFFTFPSHKVERFKDLFGAGEFVPSIQIVGDVLTLPSKSFSAGPRRPNCVLTCQQREVKLIRLKKNSCKR